MAMGYNAAGVPPGLQYLTQIDQILVHQKIELLEAITSFETNNKYVIKNSLGQTIYTAKEETDCCTRNCCGPNRPFQMEIKDHSGQEVIHLVRPFRCSSCFFPCFLQEIEVQSPPGTTVGYVVQNWHPFLPKFSIQDASKKTLLRIDGPCWACSCCGDVEFQVKSKDGDQDVGRISKQWSGLLKEAFTDTDNFGIQFPMDLDVKMKAVMLGACFLIWFASCSEASVVWLVAYSQMVVSDTFMPTSWKVFLIGTTVVFCVFLVMDFMFFESAGKSGQRSNVFG